MWNIKNFFLDRTGANGNDLLETLLQTNSGDQRLVGINQLTNTPRESTGENNELVVVNIVDVLSQQNMEI